MRRLFRIDLGKRLGVGDDQARRARQRGKPRVELVRCDAYNDAAVVKQVADRLYLRQDQASLGAWMSCGMTSSTTSPSLTSPPVTLFFS